MTTRTSNTYSTTAVVINRLVKSARQHDNQPQPKHHSTAGWRSHQGGCQRCNARGTQNQVRHAAVRRLLGGANAHPIVYFWYTCVIHNSAPVCSALFIALRASVASFVYRDLADMTCEDRTTVSKVAMDTVMLEAARFQKKYESQETLDREARSV